MAKIFEILRRRHDDVHLGRLLVIIAFIGVSSIVLLPLSPQIAQTFLIVALLLLAGWAAVFNSDG